MDINFIIPAPDSSYGNIIRNMIEPVMKFLPDSFISQKSRGNCINIHFFVEQGYQKMVNFEYGKGINVFIDHGISDKCYRDAEKVKVYDYVCVTGPLWKKKMMDQGLPENKLLTIGFAKLDPIFNDCLIKEKSVNSKIRLLWAPTHWNSVSSYPAFEAYLDKFPSNYIVTTSVHPFHKPDLIPTFNEMVEADVVISDTSSIIYETWAIGKPVVFPDWLVKNDIAKTYPDSFEDIIYRNNIGYHAQSFEELIELTRIASLQGLDSNAKEFIEGILPSYLRGNSGKQTANVLQTLQNVHRAPFEPISDSINKYVYPLAKIKKGL